MKGDKKMFRQNRSIRDLQRRQRDAHLMQLDSARREQRLQHISQQQRCAGTFPTRGKRAGAGSQRNHPEAVASGPQRQRI